MFLLFAAFAAFAAFAGRVCGWPELPVGGAPVAMVPAGAAVVHERSVVRLSRGCA